MEPSTVSSCILTLHKEFAAYTTQRLQELGLSFGLIYFVLYVGKHPDCTPSELTKDLHLDWGHSQRSLNKLAEDGFLTKEKNGRSYHLKLTQRGENAFVVCHQVFIDWDAQSLGGLTAQERQQLLTLLQKAVQEYFDKILKKVEHSLDKSNTVFGCYMCQGKMPMSVRQRYEEMKKQPIHLPNLDAMIENFDKALSHPDADDLEQLKQAVR